MKNKITIILILLLFIFAYSAFASEKLSGIVIDYNFNEDDDEEAPRKMKQVEISAYFSEEDKVVRYDFKPVESDSKGPVNGGEYYITELSLMQSYDDFAKLVTVFDKVASWRKIIKAQNITISDKRPVRNDGKDMPIDFTVAVNVSELIDELFGNSMFSQSAASTNCSITFLPWFVKRGDETLLELDVSGISIGEDILGTIESLLSYFAYAGEAGAGDDYSYDDDYMQYGEDYYDMGDMNDDWDDWFSGDASASDDSNNSNNVDYSDSNAASLGYPVSLGESVPGLSAMIKSTVEGIIAKYAPGIEISNDNFDKIHTFLKKTERDIQEFKRQRMILDRLLI